MIPFSLYIKDDQKYYTFSIFSLYFSSLNLRYLKFTKMDITRFAMELFIYTFMVSYCTMWLHVYHLMDSEVQIQIFAYYIFAVFFIFLMKIMPTAHL